MEKQRVFAQAMCFDISEAYKEYYVMRIVNHMKELLNQGTSKQDVKLQKTTQLTTQLLGSSRNPIYTWIKH